MPSGNRAGIAAPAREGTALGAILPALALALVGLAALVGHALTRPGASGQFLVLTRPSLHRAEVLDLVHDAGGGVIAFAALPGLAIVLSGDDAFPDRVRQRGAWLVLPAPMQLGCGSADAGGAQ